jgi:hypothetical protein
MVFKRFSLFSIKKLFLMMLAVTATILGMRTYSLYQQFQRYNSYTEALNFAMQHKPTFVCLYEIKCLQEKASSYFWTPPVKSRADQLADWIEYRIMYHIKNKENLKSVKNLPWLERSVVKSLDGSSCINKWYQNALYYMTRSAKK